MARRKLGISREAEPSATADGAADPEDTENRPPTEAPVSCSHRPPCPGCPHFGQPGLANAVEVPWREWCARMGVQDVQVLCGEPWGYRHRVRLAVRGRAANPKFGLFEEGSHRVVDIPSCAIHAPRLNEIARWLKVHVRRLGVPPYSDVHHAGLLRYVQLTLERGSGRVQVVLVGNCAQATPLQPLLTALRHDAPATLHSLVFNGNPERGNAVFGPHWSLCWGEPHVVDEVGGVRVFYPAGAFSQANPELFERLASEIHAWVRPGETLVEMYCGVGAIGLGLVQSARHVVFNEISSEGLAGLELGLRNLERRHSHLPVIEIARGEASVALAHVTERSTVVVDPPRKGLEPKVLAGLTERRPRQLIYVSCGFPAFRRDAESLVQSGYRLARMRGFALFPFTDHVETLAEFVLE